MQPAQHLCVTGLSNNRRVHLHLEIQLYSMCPLSRDVRATERSPWLMEALNLTFSVSNAWASEYVIFAARPWNESSLIIERHTNSTKLILSIVYKNKEKNIKLKCGHTVELMCIIFRPAKLPWGKGRRNMRYPLSLLRNFERLSTTWKQLVQMRRGTTTEQARKVIVYSQEQCALLF